MEKVRVKGQEMGEDVLITYFNDDERLVTAFVELIEAKEFVIFKTNNNIIRIPYTRVLKIKKKLQDG